MGVGGSIFLIAVGAILKFAVTVQNTHGLNINRIGLILLIVGIVALIISLFFWESWGGVGSYRRGGVSRTRRTSHIDSEGRRGVVDERDGF